MTHVVKQRSEEHTSELQSLAYLVCRLLLEKKNDGSRSTSTSTRRSRAGTTTRWSMFKATCSSPITQAYCLVSKGPTAARLFFFNDTATTEIYTLSLHVALPILFRQGRPFAIEPFSHSTPAACSAPAWEFGQNPEPALAEAFETSALFTPFLCMVLAFDENMAAEADDVLSGFCAQTQHHQSGAGPRILTEREWIHERNPAEYAWPLS